MKYSLEINLTPQTLCKLPTEDPIILPSELGISFKSNTYEINILSISVRGYNFEKKYTAVAGEEIDLSPCLKLAGKLDISVIHIVNGQDVKQWRLEPLILREVDHVFSAIPEITQLNEELDCLKEEISTLKQADVELTKLITAQEEI